MTFIKLYHSIWALGLSPNAFRTYCALLRYMNTGTWYANVAMRKLAKAVGLSEKSLARGIRELQEKKLLSIVKKYYRGYRIANGYRITPQSGRFTKLPLSVLVAPISAAGFKTYAYILKCADACKRAFPSLSGIASSIGVTLQTVITQIKELVRHKLLKKRHQIKKDNSFGRNLYRVFEKFIVAVKKEKTRLARVPSPNANLATKTNNLNIHLGTSFVNIFLKILFFIFGAWYSNFVRASTRPIFKILKKKKKPYTPSIPSAAKESLRDSPRSVSRTEINPPPSRVFHNFRDS